MKNKIVLIIPYFGRIPNYFNVWLKGVKFNPSIDFLFFTDDKKIYNYTLPSNLRVKIESFASFKERIQNVIPFKISLTEPYKLCDYRPAYGLVLQNLISGYDFWGFCDIDMVFGDISKYVSSEILQNYDRIYNLGHLSIFRNDSRINQLFMRSNNFSDCLSYKYVFTHNFGFYFDETGVYKYGYGQSTVAERLSDIRLYKNNDCADIDPSSYKLSLFDSDLKFDFIKFDHGHVYAIKDSKVKKEFVYAHFQKRDFEIDKNLNDTFYIGPSIISNDFNKVKDSLSSKRKAKNFNYRKRK